MLKKDAENLVTLARHKGIKAFVSIGQSLPDGGYEHTFRVERPDWSVVMVTDDVMGAMKYMRNF